MLLLGPGPGLNFDLVTFSFHVPENISAPYTIVAENASPATSTSENTSSLFLIINLRKKGRGGSPLVPERSEQQLQRELDLTRCRRRGSNDPSRRAVVVARKSYGV